MKSPSNKKISINAKWAAASVNIEVEMIDRFIESVGEYVIIERDRLQKEYDKADQNDPKDYDTWSYKDSLIDENLLLSDIENMSYQFSLVGLYRIVEIQHKKILQTNKYRKNDLEKKYMSLYGIDITHIPHYKKIDELRELNNKIKHDPDLKEIKNIKKKCNSLKKSIAPFFSAIYKKIYP